MLKLKKQIRKENTMAKFNVIIQIWDHLLIEVEAENQDEAIKIVEDNISNYSGSDGYWTDGGRDIVEVEEIEDDEDDDDEEDDEDDDDF
jgi:hypothetical protein